MKNYWPLLVISLVLLTIMGMSQYADHSKRDYEKSHAQISSASVAKDKNGQPSEHTDETYKPPVWGQYVTFPDGLGAWAVVLTLLAIVWQSIETRKAAEASAESARVAQRDHEVMRNKEKPRITLSLGNPTFVFDSPISTAFGEKAAVPFTISFRCPTAAYIKSADVGVQTRTEGNPQPPRYLYRIEIPPIIETNTVKTLQADIGGVADRSSFTSTAYERLGAGEVMVVFQLKICYEDNFGEREFAVCKILRAAGLKNLDGSPFLTWSDGPKHLQVDT